MTLTLVQIRRWDAGAVRSVAAAAAARAGSAEAAAAALQSMPVWRRWSGAAADGAARAVAATGGALREHAAEAGAVADAARRAADAIERIQAELRRLGSEPDPAGLRRLVAAAGAVDTDLARSLGWCRVPAPEAPRPQAPPAESAAAEEFNRWWNTLSRAEKDRLIAADPLRWGDRDGVPCSDRDTANRILMEHDIARVEQAATRRGVAVSAVTADPDGHGLESVDITRYRNAVEVRRALNGARDDTGADTLLVIYRPEAFGGRGRAAIALGDPDLAADTAVVVPGTGNSVTGGWLREVDATSLYREMDRAEPRSNRSVVAWMGYQTPDSLADLRVTQPDLARRGGAALAADVDALLATRRAPGHLTVIGHSYGATTVADAAAGSGMRADDVVLVGCPGTDLARSAADFGLPGHVYVGAASTDPVTGLAGLPGHLPLTGLAGLPGHLPLTGLAGLEIGLGADPAADGFGSTRFKAEVPGPSTPVGDHGGYFDDGSESLYSMVDVVCGHGADLQAHGMTAPHRMPVLGPLAAPLGLPSWSDPLDDPELLRPGTGGHRHQPITAEPPR